MLSYPWVQKVQTNSVTAGRVRVSPPPLSVQPLNPHSQKDKMPFVGRNRLGEILGQNAKTSTKVVLYEPQKQRIQKWRREDTSTRTTEIPQRTRTSVDGVSFKHWQNKASIAKYFVSPPSKSLWAIHLIGTESVSVILTIREEATAHPYIFTAGQRPKARFQSHPFLTARNEVGAR